MDTGYRKRGSKLMTVLSCHFLTRYLISPRLIYQLNARVEWNYLSS